MDDAGQTFGTAFGVLFAAVGLLFAAMGIGVVVLILRRAVRRSRIRSRGVLVEAEVMGTSLAKDRDEAGRGTRIQRAAVLVFRTEDGQEVRVRDTSGVPRVAGDRVAVRYRPGHPREAIPMDGGARVGARIVVGLFVAFFSVFALAGLIVTVIGIAVAIGVNQLPEGF
ncbi:DUF3592 domain-containing protein [Kitasatospora sp. NPDC004531]